MMRLKTVIGVVVFILTLAGTALAGPMALVKEDRLVLSSPFRVNEIVRGVFFVGNPGDSPLTITAVQGDCNCTKASYDNTVPPGGWGRVLLQVDTRGETGKRRKEAIIYTDDPNRYKIKITLIYTIQEK